MNDYEEHYDSNGDLVITDTEAIRIKCNKTGTIGEALQWCGRDENPIWEWYEGNMYYFELYPVLVFKVAVSDSTRYLETGELPSAQESIEKGDWVVKIRGNYFKFSDAEFRKKFTIM